MQKLLAVANLDRQAAISKFNTNAKSFQFYIGIEAQWTSSNTVYSNDRENKQ
jgi:hypothetical protein